MAKRRVLDCFPQGGEFLANVISAFKDNLRAIHEGLFFYKSLFKVRTKIGAAPVAGQALLPKKTLRVKLA